MKSVRAKRSAVFFTFYSYKGGVGRTMALLNTACMLAGRGRRVLMIDFDLEAPGLTTLGKLAVQEERNGGAGLVELLHNFLNSGNDPELSPLSNRNRTAFRESYVTSLHIPEYVRKIEGGCLDLLPCGQMDNSYGSRLLAIDFVKMYAERVGSRFFGALKELIRETELYDYVFIDSRTGFSDEAGICTRDLADYLCVVTGWNQQNITGTTRFLRQLQESGSPCRDPERVIIVISPDPGPVEGYTEREAEVIAELRDTGFHTQLPFAAPDTFSSLDLPLRLPYTPQLSIKEDPWSSSWEKTRIFAAYVNLQLAIRKLVQDDPDSLLLGVPEAVNQGRHREALHILHQLSKEDPKAVATHLTAITSNWFDRDTPNGAPIEEYFTLWLNSAGNTAAIRLRFGRVLQLQGNLSAAEAQYETALRLADSSEDFYYMALVRTNFAALFCLRGQFEQASMYLHKALRILSTRGHETADKAILATIYHTFGTVSYLQENFDQAKAQYDMALSIAQAEGYTLNAGAALSQLAKIEVACGNRENGLDMLREAIRKVSELSYLRLAAEGWIDYVECLLRINDLNSADSVLNDRWDMIQNHASVFARHIAFLLRAELKGKDGDSSGMIADASLVAAYFDSQDIRLFWSEQAHSMAQGILPPDKQSKRRVRALA